MDGDKLKKNKGLSLIDAVFSVAILLIAIMGVNASFTTLDKNKERNKNLSLATEIIEDELIDVKVVLINNFNQNLKSQKKISREGKNIELKIESKDMEKIPMKLISITAQIDDFTLTQQSGLSVDGNPI